MANDCAGFAVRLRASKSLLASFQGAPAFVHISGSECEELLKELEGVAMTTVQVANFMEDIRLMNFGQGEERQLLQALRKKLASPVVVAPLSGKSTATSGTPTAASCVFTAASGHSTDAPKLQNYEALTLFLPNSVWERLKKGETVTYFRFLSSLGLVSLSEPTARNLSLAILGAQHTPDDIVAMARDDKCALAEATKAAFHRTRALCPPPRHHLPTLHSTVQAFQSEYPDWFDELYAQELPAMPPWPKQTWARLVSSTNCRKLRGASSFLRSSGSFVAPSASGPNGLLMQQLQYMQQQIQALQPGFDSRRFTTGPTSPVVLPNGALLTIRPKPGEADCAEQNGPATARSLEDAPCRVDAADAAGTAVEATPAKRPRISVDAVAQRILQSASAAKSGSPTAEAGNSGSPTAESGKSGPPTPEGKTVSPKAAGKKKKAGAATGTKQAWPGVPASVCPLAAKHDGEAKAFTCHWHKLCCKTYKYESAKDRPCAQKLAMEWLKKMGEKHGIKTPAIQW